MSWQSRLVRKPLPKQSKRASKAIVIPYTRVRQAFSNSLGAQGIASDFLHTRAVEIANSSHQSSWQQDDNARSALALNHLAEIVHRMECTKAVRVHKPEGGWPALNMQGVRVSVQPELVFTLENRGVTKVGAVILNTGQSESLSLDRNSGHFSVGDYLTVLVYLMLDTHLKNLGLPLHTKCYAVDIFREKIYSAPKSYRTMLKNLRASCRMIALQWEAVPVEVGSEEIATEEV